MHLEFYAILLVFAPLVAAMIVGLSCSVISDKMAQVITCSGAILSAISAFAIFNSVVFEGNIVHVHLARWFKSSSFIVNWSIYIDVLTAVMLILVTSVSALVHIYSIGYMSHDEHKPRFMAYLSLFTFCMIMLVCADNLVQLFFGWEGVGLSSYLLIGFWFKRDSANVAAIKAFLVNRVGDLGFALGIFLAYVTFNSVEFRLIFPQVSEILDQTLPLIGCEVKTIDLMCLLLFIGCMGKSAQLGLHTWLPDAMEGPTPVSALIHAATMVTAGVFLTARLSPIFEFSEVTLHVITIVGAVTCIFAASIALVQNDIKKIIAYSTCSQLGYMFFASGVSAYAAGVFHLLTHGFFKALLFLSAGSVIHAMSNEQNIQKMGGLWKLIPFTFAMMLIGSLALGGIFPFAGYYSKDIILESAYASGTIYGMVAYWLGLVTAALTAFYSWRLLILVFNGKPKASTEVIEHIHESPLSMTLPLFLLSIGAIFAGYVGEHALDIVNPEGKFWRGSIFQLAQHNTLERAHHIENWVKLSPLFAGIFGIIVAYFLYMIKPSIPQIMLKKFKSIYQLLANKWYFDEIYGVLFVRTAKSLSLRLWKVGDVNIVDNLPNGAALISYKFAKIVSFLQTGYIYHYALIMFIGLVALLTWSLIWI